MRHSQRLGKEGLIDRKGIFFVAAPLFLILFFLSFLPLQELPQQAPKLLNSSAFHSATGISGSAFFKNKEPPVHWHMKGGERLGVTCQGELQAPPKGGSGEGSSAHLSPGLHEHITQITSPPGWLVQTEHLQRSWVLVQLWGAAPSPCPGVGTSIHQPWCSWRVQRDQQRTGELGPWLCFRP